MRHSSCRLSGRLSRRYLLQAGALGAFGLTLPRVIQASESGSDNRWEGLASRPRKVRSCILIFYYGGPSHVDTYDMKPEAPAEVRGEFRPIETSAPGVWVCDHLPHTARVMDKVCVIRSMHHGMRNHNSAAVEALCGRAPLRGDLELLADDELSFPCYGAVMEYALGRQGSAWTSVALPHVMRNVVRLPGQGPGLLGKAYSPFQIEADPNSPNFGVGVLNLPGELPLERLGDREALLRRMESTTGTFSDEATTAYQARAFELLRSERVRRALDVSREAETVRERYGRTRFGQSLVLARRLVEADVRFVSVYDGIANGQDANWDSHASVFPRMTDHLLPPTDLGFASLIEDLEARGLLDETLVIAMGEFGRTPRINGAGGRDHWPDCYSVLLAGGGIGGGRLHGSSDRIGAYPATDPVTPGDLAATLCWAFGIAPDQEVRDTTGRPFHLAVGRPLTELFVA